MASSVDVGIGYATQQVRIPDGLIEEKVVVAGACRDQPLGLGMLYYEDGIWSVTTFGIAKVEPAAHLSRDVRAGRRNPAATRQRRTAGRRTGRRGGLPQISRQQVAPIRQTHRLPTGIIPFGDAVASFNPTFGQGMTMSSIQAGNLRTVLESGDPDIAGRLAKATAKTTYPVWTMTAIGDQVLHLAPGPRPWWYGPVGNLFDQFLGAAETDPVLAEWFLRRFSLLDSLYMVPSPALVGRTVRHNMRLWWAGRGHSTGPQSYPASARSRSGSR